MLNGRRVQVGLLRLALHYFRFAPSNHGGNYVERVAVAGRILRAADLDHSSPRALRAGLRLLRYSVGDSLDVVARSLRRWRFGLDPQEHGHSGLYPSLALYLAGGAVGGGAADYFVTVVQD